jgi:hypothetical protein
MYSVLLTGKIKTLKQAKQIAGTLSNPSKMPGFGYGLPAEKCNVGARLAQIADSVCAKCYALRGNYQYENVKKSLLYRLESLMHPYWVDAMVYQITVYSGKKNIDVFRWHDSGDLQSLRHLEMICEVCHLTPNIKHWLPTREVSLVRQYLAQYGEFPANLCVRVSSPMIGQKPIKGFPNTSTVIRKREDEKGFVCPAGTQGNECGDCRECWNRDRQNVPYPVH